MRKYLSFKENPEKTVYEVIFGKDNLIGHLGRDVDGYYYYLPINGGGLWSSYWMREIADKLDEINKPWDDFIANDPAVNGSYDASSDVTPLDETSPPDPYF